ncbi:MAG TPA: aminotransferase class III-fold pyridoxal phosphate-dependent enzyme [Verrucomicrobiales bacterium]|nr:aminotransferase class III-fold pyridoxal phosphate-dependent enzyme [Verrucomicrobiales bacterium]
MSRRIDLGKPVDPVDIAALQKRRLMQCWSSQAGYQPIPALSAEGCWIHTAAGRRIFDLRSAHECINLGFRHPKVVDAIRRQLESVIFVTDDFATEPTARLADRLAQLAPGPPDKKVLFTQSGSAAVEAAVKAARLCRYHETFGPQSASLPNARSQYPFPYKIISRYRSWHGATAGAASLSGDPRRWFQEPSTMPGVVFTPEINLYRSPFGPGSDPFEASLSFLDYQIEQEGGSGKVAALLIEPVVGSNGIIPPPPGYLQRIRKLCDQWNLLLIADETMTGLGRTGKLFAVEHDGVVPDILVLGKALGAYCPLAATIFGPRVAAAFETNIFGHGQSHSGHALACAAALAALEVLLDDGLLEQSQSNGAWLGERLQEIGMRHPCVGDIRGLGMFWTLDLVRDQASRQPLRRFTEKYERSVVNDIAEYLLRERDVYVPSDKFGIWVVPPLVATREELCFVLEAIDDALRLAD